MHDAAVLDVRARADDDMADVGAQHAIIPDADVGSDRHVADDAATRRDEGAGVDPRSLAVDADDADGVHSSRPQMIFFQLRTGSAEAQSSVQRWNAGRASSGTQAPVS